MEDSTEYADDIMVWMVSEDTVGYIAFKLILELIEFGVQTQALLLYNGFNAFDPDRTENSYLAAKPEAIDAFAMLLSFNIIGSGMLWCCYGLFPLKCNGLVFKRALFFVDKLCLFT